MNKRLNLSAITLGMLLAVPAFAQDAATWQNDDPACAPAVYSETVSVAKEAQEKSKKDAEAVNDFMKAIKDNPRSASDLANSCVIDSWPDFNVGSLMGIDMNPIIDKIGNQVVNEACQKQRELIRKADSAFKLPDIKSGVLSGIQKATGNLTGNSTVNNAIGNAVNQGTNNVINNTTTPTNVKGNLDRLIKGGNGNGPAR